MYLFPLGSPVCHNDSKWLPMGDHIESHFARGETSYLVLQLKLDGFRTEGSKTDGEAVTVGRFKMVFETICESYCQLVLLSVSLLCGVSLLCVSLCIMRKFSQSFYYFSIITTIT